MNQNSNQEGDSTSLQHVQREIPVETPIRGEEPDQSDNFSDSESDINDEVQENGTLNPNPGFASTPNITENNVISDQQPIEENPIDTDNNSSYSNQQTSTLGTDYSPAEPETSQAPILRNQPLKKGTRVRFKGLGPGDEWFEAELVSRSGKAKGTYKNSWNILRDGSAENIDFDRDVSKFEILQHEQTPSIEDEVSTTVESIRTVEGETAQFPTTTINNPLPEAPAEEFLIDEIYISELETEKLAAKTRELQSWKSQQVYKKFRTMVRRLLAQNGCLNLS